MKVSSTGNAAPSIRSINVRANVLSEWTINRGRYRMELLRCLAGVACCLVAGGTILPLCSGARAEVIAHQRLHESTLKRLQADIAVAQEAKQSAEPKVAVAQMHALTSKACRRLLGELYQVLDSAKAGMAFSSARIDVRGAEAAIVCHADAESYEVAAAFAEHAGTTPNKISTLSSSRPNGLLGPAGIGFEYIKRVGLE